MNLTFKITLCGNIKMKKNIAIIMGGYSSEYQISLKSGNVVYNTLDKNNITHTAYTFLKTNGFM